MRWPLPFPAEEFIARPTELAAWVALDGDAVVGHVALLDVAPGWEADGWGEGTGLPASALAAVAVLFVDPGATGRGVGSTLLAAAVAARPVAGPHPGARRGQREHPGRRALRAARLAGRRAGSPAVVASDREPLLLMALGGDHG